MTGGKKNEAARRKLELWQKRLAIAQSAWAAERGKMDRREQLYRGSHDIYQPDGKLAREKASHVRNVIFEIVETQVDSNIPQPKVTAVREEDPDAREMEGDSSTEELVTLYTAYYRNDVPVAAQQLIRTSKSER